MAFETELNSIILLSVIESFVFFTPYPLATVTLCNYQGVFSPLHVTPEPTNMFCLSSWRVYVL